ncbi:alpha-mannosidase, partial [Lusitaniella coriacea LEGE 07157]|nr:alpha-mannosidase [Lusitaniella coriacea LEGE 07157]
MSESISPDFSSQITAIITKLKGLVYTDRQEKWYSCFDDLPISPHTCPPINPETWEPVRLNEKGYIIWEAGHRVCWLAQRFRIPHNFNGYPLQGLSLRFVLTWWADDAKIFINGQLVQEGDLFESSVRILLTEAAIPGEEFIVAIRLVSPGHDIGGLMKSYCIFEKREIAPGFVADEIAVLQRYWQAFEPEKLTLLATELEKIEWEEIGNAEQFNTSLATLRQTLQPHATSIKKRYIKMLSHAHLDMAWLWEVEETWDVAQRTFESVLNLQKDFLSLTFCHTSPVLYEWVEKNRPDLFVTIQEAVRSQSWDVLGGMWVEPDVNLVSGESIVRQLLYGQRYTQEKFGKIATVAWLTDSFGFCWQLPQLLKQAGIEYFVTQKLHWNDTTKFPHGAFWWESPDGTQIFTLMSPPNIAGIMDTNPNTLTTYAVDWEKQTGLQEIFWLPGVGDRGGGPSRDMLEVQQDWQQSPFFPRIEFTIAQNYLQNVQRLLQQREDTGENAKQPIPIWKDELYLEFHRGCYTTHADQKRYNRRGEALLYQAELWSTLAHIIGESSSLFEGNGDIASNSLPASSYTPS